MNPIKPSGITPRDIEDVSPQARLMRLAVELAYRGLGQVEPNPMVGCLIVDPAVVESTLHENPCLHPSVLSGTSLPPGFLGVGYHKKFGGPHAEVEALADCRRRGQSPEGMMAVVTLEPCCHFGKTPPCADALIEAKVGQVVVGSVDPNPRVDRGGLQRLRDAGVDVTVGVAGSDCRELIAPFVKNLKTGLPWVIAKWAMSIDGKIATRTGSSQWITGPLAREDVHRERGCVDAIVCGYETLNADDPELTARPPGPRTAMRWVLCGSRLPKVDCRLLATVEKAPVHFVFDSTRLDSTDPRFEALKERGAEVHFVDDADRRTQVQDVVRKLGGQPCTRVIVEGGGKLLGSFFEADAIDEIHSYIGGKLIGGHDAPGPVGGSGIESIDHAMRFQLVDSRGLGPDVRLTFRRRPAELPPELAAEKPLK